jgi:hypothetical protein
MCRTVNARYRIECSQDLERRRVLVDAADARAHLVSLADASIGTRQVAALMGLSRTRARSTDSARYRTSNRAGGVV